VDAILSSACVPVSFPRSRQIFILRVKFPLAGHDQWGEECSLTIRQAHCRQSKISPMQRFATWCNSFNFFPRKAANAIRGYGTDGGRKKGRKGVGWGSVFYKPIRPKHWPGRGLPILGSPRTFFPRAGRSFFSAKSRMASADLQAMQCRRMSQSVSLQRRIWRSNFQKWNI
jgi:hypothetical protein